MCSETLSSKMNFGISLCHADAGSNQYDVACIMCQTSQSVTNIAHFESKRPALEMDPSSPKPGMPFLLQALPRVSIRSFVYDSEQILSAKA